MRRPPPTRGEHGSPPSRCQEEARVKARPPRSRRVKVVRGDTLRKIAKRYDVEGGWRGLWKLNKKTVKNPNRIYVGQVLRIQVEDVMARVGPCPPVRPPAEARQTRICRASAFPGPVAIADARD